MPRPYLIAAALCLSAAPALADVAILLTMDATERRTERQVTRVLERQGFEVLAQRSAAPDAVTETLAAGFEALSPEERVIVFMAGQTAVVGARSYQLSRVPDGANAFSVARDGVEIGPVLDALAGYPGRAALLVSSEADPVRVGPGVVEARVAELPAGVALVEGSVAGLRQGLAALASDEPVSLARAFAASEVSGYAPEGVAFARAVAAAMPEEAAEDVPDAEALFWEITQQIGTADAFRAYLARHPDGAFQAQAERRLAALAPVIIPPTEETPEARAEAAEAALALDRNERRGVQQDLVLLGYNTRGVDGIFGPGSRGAIRSWQEARGFESTGYLTGNQLVALRNQAETRREEIAAEDEAFWARTGASGAEADLRAYLERYPQGRFAETARADLADIEGARRAEAEAVERAAWNEARAADRPAAYRDFLRRFPDGRFAEEARARLAGREAPQPRRGPSDDQVAQDRAQEGEVLANPIARLLAERQLAALGLDIGPIDGRFTNATRRGIRAFQESRNLPATGFVGRATGVALLASATR
ncbi:MAG: peptidoglycan-binding domain-containing protein [Pseudomonadota bacterium]